MAERGARRGRGDPRRGGRRVGARSPSAGADLLAGARRVITHCNTGALATGGSGSALAVLLELHARGTGVEVLACETRPLLQGARLTVWELARAGVPHALIVDAAAAGLLARGEADAVIVGCDRVAANGDVANKVGTYGLALAARAAGVPFVVAGPISTIDPRIASGEEIEIEERGADEVLTAGGQLADAARHARSQPGVRRDARGARQRARHRARRRPRAVARRRSPRCSATRGAGAAR